MKGKTRKKRKEVRPTRYGNYILLDRVNVGGMAEVFRAKSSSLEGVQRLVAIKRILPHLARDDEFTDMFIDEARIAVNLHHANIAQVYELSRVNNSLYIAMEYVHGQDLRHLINRARRMRKGLPIALVTYIISQLCEGLDYAHRKKDLTMRELGIVHRDISPQNIIVSYDGEVKVIDFGIAKASSKRNHTEAGILKGKFGYMAPEQVMGEEIDRRADIFCAGILLYEMLTSERLFAGSNELSTLQKIRNVEVTPPTILNPMLPEALEEIILKTLAPHPDDRYQYASDLQEDLQRFQFNFEGDVFSSKRLRKFMSELFEHDIEEDRKILEHLLSIEVIEEELVEGDTERVRPSMDSRSPENSAQALTQGEQYPQTPRPQRQHNWNQSPAPQGLPQSVYAPSHAPVKAQRTATPAPARTLTPSPPGNYHPTSSPDGNYYAAPSAFDELDLPIEDADEYELLMLPEDEDDEAPTIAFAQAHPDPPSSPTPNELNAFAESATPADPIATPVIPPPPPVAVTRGSHAPVATETPQSPSISMATHPPRNAKRPLWIVVGSLLGLIFLAMLYVLFIIPPPKRPPLEPIVRSSPSKTGNDVLPPPPPRGINPLTQTRVLPPARRQATTPPPRRAAKRTPPRQRPLTRRIISRRPSPPPRRPEKRDAFTNMNIQSNPRNAKIFINGRYYENTPKTVPLKPRRRPYKLSLRKTGYSPYVINFHVRPNEPGYKIIGTLRRKTSRPKRPTPRPAARYIPPKEGYITAKGNPMARISINGKDTGRYVLYRHKLPAGVYILQFKSERGERWVQKVRIRPGKTTQLISKHKK